MDRSTGQKQVSIAGKTYWLVMSMQRFDQLDLGSLGYLPVQIKTEVEPFWYAPVFESREAAIEWNGSDRGVYQVAHVEAEKVVR